MSLEIWVAGIVGLAAIAEDLARRTISNWIPLTAFSGGLLCQWMERRWEGLGCALAGSAAGFLVFLVFYLLGGMGGGDVKLMAGFGALLGVSRLLAAAFWAAVAGGVIATAVIAAVRLKKGTGGKPDSIPYAPAIAVGVWLALIRLDG